MNGRSGNTPIPVFMIGARGDGKGDCHDTGNPHDAIDIEIRCPVESRVLALIRCFVKSVAQEVGFAEEEIDKIEMAVDEACANVIRHAYKHLGISPDIAENQRIPAPSLKDIEKNSPQQCSITMRITIHDNCLRIQIIDYGIGLDKTDKGVSSIDEYLAREGRGGLGLYIIRNFMDEVNYEFPENHGTVLTMTKYLPAYH